MTKTQETGSRAYLLSIVLVAIIGGLLFGYDTAVVSGAEQALDQFFRSAADFTYTPWVHCRACWPRVWDANARSSRRPCSSSSRPSARGGPKAASCLTAKRRCRCWRRSTSTAFWAVSAWDLPRPCVRCTLPKSRPRRSAARSSRATSSPSSSACWSSTS